MENRKCLFCDNTASFEKRGPLDNTYVYNCASNCGHYQTDSSFAIDKLSSIQKSSISGYIAEMNENGHSIARLTNENVSDILNSSIVARTISEKINKLLLYAVNRTSYFGERFELYREHYSLCYSANKNEFDLILAHLVQIGFLQSTDMFHFILTFNGIQAAEEIKKTHSISNSAFVAMWFSDDMKLAFEKAIKPAIEAEECGDFIAFRVDNKEHNNDITDEILAGIKACRFMVADLTGYRGGVYFEAGYAKGLGKPVILTCRNDWLKNVIDAQGKTLQEGVHFDLNHQNIIVWDDLEEFKKRIINRIRYTIL